jgi:uncharacterized protein (TIGR03083 family)
MTPGLHSLDYLDHLARESARFAAALREADADAPVPTCPGWDADDLLWHLADVQWFWGTIVQRRLLESAETRALVHPDRPTERDVLRAFYASASQDLQAGVASAAPETAVWTWSQDRSVGFIRRRQAHEALIHRLDAELTAGNRTPMDAQLSADGVDEVVRVMYGELPDWCDFTERGGTVRIRTTDTGDSWHVTVGRVTGVDPDDGDVVDEPAFQVADVEEGQPAAATITGAAADLDCWLWRRPSAGSLEHSGDPDVLAAVALAIDDGLQ